MSSMLLLLIAIGVGYYLFIQPQQPVSAPTGATPVTTSPEAFGGGMK